MQRIEKIQFLSVLGITYKAKEVKDEEMQDTNGSITDNINDRNVRHEEKKGRHKKNSKEERETTKIKCNGIE